MRRVFLILFLLPIHLCAQQFTLSDQAEISIITCGPYQEELYSAFGHSAIRVHDPAIDYDAAYNYGVFDFNQPNFYLNFARGYLFYKLGVYDYQRFQNHYIIDNRYVHEQVLNLTQEQKQKMFDFLQHNAMPENTTYRYDYFYNNCATKMRDVVMAVLGDSVTFHGSYIKTDYTIRDLTDLYIQKQQPWGDLGIDICLGLPMDKTAAPLEYMFLPDYVESGFDHASITTHGQKLPLVKKKNIIYEAREEEPVKGLPHPLYFTGIIAMLAAFLVYRDLKKKKLSKWFDVLLFGITGTIGLLLFFLWFMTDHRAAAYNMNILWAMPLHFVTMLFYFRNPAWIKTYFGITMLLSVLLLIFWFVLPQELHYATIPIVIAQGLRGFAIYRLNP